MPFFYGNRVSLLLRRGPFSSSTAWLKSLLHLQIASSLDQMKAIIDEDGYESPNIPELINGIAAAHSSFWVSWINFSMKLILRHSS